MTSRNVRILIVLGTGVMLIASPFLLYRVSSDHYDRYVWIINGLFPTGYFGTGSFSLVMGLVLFFGVCFLIALYFLRNNLRRGIFILIGIATMPALIYGGLLFFTSHFWRGLRDSAPFSIEDALLFKVNDCHLSGSGSGAPATPYFTKSIQDGVIDKMGGPPIEGFEPFMFMEAYPELHASDFNCVKTYAGFYIARDDRIIFISERMHARSTIDHTITPYGMNRMLQNISDRFGLPWPHANAEVRAIINAINTFPILITPPNGWYIHHTNSGNLLVMKQKELPNIGATEGYAYGEHISISTTLMSASPKEWVAQKTHIDLDDHALVRKSDWEMIGEYLVLRVEHEAAGAAGKQLSYYIFNGDRVYIASLFPLEKCSDAVCVENDGGIKALEQIVLQFTD
ncbi:MAG: hypothetical protein NUV61_03260 [Candidatus Azambacteria bacterium]|nr:hypothetical protein [Candidatus Azambacteria bacterium]